MAYKNLKSLNDAYDAGQYRVFNWRKQPTQTTASGIWFDLSMSPGNPVPNYYAAAPLEFKVLAQSTDGGLMHGASVGDAVKYIHKLTVISLTATAVPLPMKLLDYLGYYPFIDMSITEEQPVFNTAALTRYTDGAGVQVMAVEVASQIGGVSFFITYTNSAGETGRISPTVTCNTQVVNGTIINTAPATNGCAGSPFIPLQQGDSGVRSIQSVTFLTGDVGLITLVLVKPLASLAVHDITAPVERDFFREGMSPPSIEDDAYLNFVVYPSGTLASAQITGLIETVWI